MVNFVNDSNRNLLKNFPWKFRKVSCHTVDWSDSTDSDSVVVSTAITHNTDRTNACVNSEVLPYITIKTSFGNFFTKDSIRLTNGFKFLFSDFTHNTDGKSWSWERLTPNDFIRHSHFSTKGTNFIFKEGIKWFNQFKLHVFWKTTNVVVRFDCLSCLSTWFNNISVKCPLS